MVRRLQYEIKGMSCAACVAHVERAVKGVLDPEDRFTVSLLTNSISILPAKELDEAQKSVLEHRLSVAVRAAGYRLLTSPPKEEKKNAEFHGRLIRLIISAVFTLLLMYIAMGSMLSLPLPAFLDGVDNALTMALTQLLLALPVVVLNFQFFRSGISALVHLAPNMDSLIAIGSGASLIYGLISIFMIAAARGDHEALHGLMHDLYFESAATILTLVSLGKLLESRAKDRAADAVKSLAKLSPKHAAVLREGKEVLLPVEEIRVGDLVLVRMGDLIPVDGEVVEGSGAADESALTGESMPVDKETGSLVRAACVLSSGAVTVRATGVGEDTSLSRMIRLLEDAAASKAPIARIADRVSAVFVPCVIAISLLTFALWMFFSRDLSQALRSAIAVLVISCPCALGLATPTAITVGIGRGARNGILFRNAESLEKLCSVKTVVFDKTGTITEGKPILSDLFVFGDRPEELLATAAAVERLSSHPLAIAVCQAAEASSLTLPVADQFEGLVGMGAVATVNGKRCYVGKPDPDFRKQVAETIAKTEKEPFPVPVKTLGGITQVYEEATADETAKINAFACLERQGKTAVLITVDGCVIGVLGISDAIREDSGTAAEALKTAGVRCLMLTGDNERTAAFVAEKVNLDGYRAGLLPEDKEQVLRELCADGATAMVGDGINDAPALLRADVGIAVGAGTEIAIDCAGVVLSGSSLMGVAEAYRLSRATIRIIKQNLFWALFYNAVCIPVAAGLFYPFLGWQLSPMLASAAMSVSSVFVVMNALRLRRVPLVTKTEKKAQNIEASSCSADECHSDCDQTKGGQQNMLFGKKAQTYVIGVEGMMCQKCVAHVKNALESVKGVKSVDVNLEQKNATVIATANLSALTAAITNAGYEVK